jgi:hypothetical protein
VKTENHDVDKAVHRRQGFYICRPGFLELISKPAAEAQRMIDKNTEKLSPLLCDSVADFRF